MTETIRTYFCVTVLTLLPVSLLHATNTIIKDPTKACNSIRRDVLYEAKDSKGWLKALPTSLIHAGMWAARYDKQTRANVDIARPFFTVNGANQCLGSIGSSVEDIAYFQSVFTEFYSSGEQTVYRLITILHRHMMEKLGLPKTTTLEQFRHMMEKTNKKGYPKALSASQFKIYCECVARGLYAVYWVDHKCT